MKSDHYQLGCDLHSNQSWGPWRYQWYRSCKVTAITARQYCNVIYIWGEQFGNTKNINIISNRQQSSTINIIFQVQNPSPIISTSSSPHLQRSSSSNALPQQISTIACSTSATHGILSFAWQRFQFTAIYKNVIKRHVQTYDPLVSNYTKSP